MVVGDVGAVQLQNQFAVDDDLLVLVTAVAAHSAQHCAVQALDAGTSVTHTRV